MRLPGIERPLSTLALGTHFFDLFSEMIIENSYRPFKVAIHHGTQGPRGVTRNGRRSCIRPLTPRPPATAPVSTRQGLPKCGDTFSERSSAAPGR